MEDAFSLAKLLHLFFSLWVITEFAREADSR